MPYTPEIPPKDCTGCGACLNVCPAGAISWSRDNFFAEVPSIDASLCIGCGKCEKVCPQKSSSFTGVLPQKAFAAWLKDASKLEKAASGGAASTLSRFVVGQGGLVFGCAFSDGKCHHTRVENEAGLDGLAGSKYVWSDTEKTFSDVKQSLSEAPERLVLFVGTPCQVAGLKAFLGKELSASPSLVTADLICHGVPPAKYLEDHVMTSFGGRAVNVKFRDREAFCLSGALDGGRAFCQKRSSSVKDGEYRHLYNDAYLAAFLNGVSYRENCYSCRYARPERGGDLTLGDVWGAVEKELLPDNVPAMASIVFVNTQRGSALFGKASDFLETSEVSVIRGIFGKDNMKSPTPRPDVRDKFLPEVVSHGAACALQTWLDGKNAARKKARSGIKHFVREILNSFDALVKKSCAGLERLAPCKVPCDKPLVRITTIGKEYLFDNYGSFLQHFALRYFLKKHDFAVFRNHWDERTSNVLYERYRWWRPHLISGYYAALTMKILFHSFRVRRLGDIYALKQRFSRAIRFRKSYGRMIGRIIENPSRMPDVCITGSDQVFGSNALREQIYLLQQDVPPSIPKISYAASAKWATQSKDDVWRSTLASALRGFSAIGVRESVGCGVCTGLVPEKTVKHTADPTLLLTKDDYLSFVGKKQIFKSKVLLCYLLHCDEKTLHLDELVELAEKLGAELKIIGCQGTENFVPEKYGFDPSPEDFLRAYRDAAYVITNSFHGTVFAIQFEKQWLTLDQEKGDTVSQNARHADMLHTLGLEARSAVFAGVDGTEKLLTSPIDWKSVEEKLSSFRKDGGDWLLEAIETAVKKGKAGKK